MTTRPGSVLWLVIGAVLCTSDARAQSLARAEVEKYRLPTKDVKLAGPHRDTVLSAKTVTVLVTARPLVNKEGKAGARATYRAGRVGPDKAREEVEQALRDWGMFALVDEPGQADLVFVLLEETLPPSYGFKEDIRGPQFRLKDTLGVFSGRTDSSTEPLWAGTVTEGRFSRAFSKTPSAAVVIEEFRRDFEDARKRARK